MTSTIETGHIKNVANFETLINFVKAYGEVYKPIKSSLTIAELENKKTEAQTAINETQTAKAQFDTAVNARQNTFEGLKPFGTRLVNAFAVSGADALAVKVLKSINKKLQGSKSSAAAQSAITDNSDNPQTVKISTSQQSYDHQANHFARMIEVVKQHPAFVPNETELTTPELEKKLSGLQSANTGVINAYTVYSNAMIRRNQSLYDPITGIARTAKEVKQYVKSLFGATSPQYKQISGIEFRNKP